MCINKTIIKTSKKTNTYGQPQAKSITPRLDNCASEKSSVSVRQSIYVYKYKTALNSRLNTGHHWL